MCKKAVSLLLVVATLVGVLPLAGCGPTPAPTSPPAPTTVAAVAPTAGPVTPLRVAFICTGVVDDRSWNQWIYEGLFRLQNEGQLELSVSEQVDVPDYERVATQYAQEGYDLVLGNTPEMQEASLAVAEKYPDLHFAIVGGWIKGPNQASLLIHQSEGGYLAGLLAGSLSKSGKMAAIGCFDVPTQIASHEGFKLGVAAVNPQAEVQDVWSGTWYDVNIGYESAQAAIESGADVLLISCSGPGFGVVEAAKSKGPDVIVIGAFVDMHELAPDNIATSIVWDSYPSTKEMLDDIRAGKFEGKDYWGTVANGGIGLSPYWAFESRIPDDVKALIATRTQEIIKGTLEIPWIGEKPAE